MHPIHRCRWGALLACCLLCLLAACGSNAPSPPSSSSSNTPAANGTTVAGQKPGTPPSSTAPSTTTAMPPTQTDCPAAGTARALVTAPLALGSHQNFVYQVNEGPYNAPTFGTLKRYDAVTGQKTEIVKLAHTIVSLGQVSADGEWLLFVASTGGQNKLQVVRMDGQGLQTLYCLSAGSNGQQFSPLQWSTDQRKIAFSLFDSGSHTENIYLLNTGDGTIQTLFTTSAAPGSGVNLRTWLDNTRLYVTNTPIDQPPDTLYILDTNKGPNQHMSDLTTVFHGPPTIGDFDSSYNGAQLFIDHSGCGMGGCYPPSDIITLPATGGSQHTIMHNASYNMAAVRAISQQQLLVVIKNDVPNVTGIPPADRSHNGLWIMNTDGTGLRRLTTEGTSESTSLNSFSQYPWSNVSRDGSTYALLVIKTLNPGTNPLSYTLLIGNLNGGTPLTIASIADGTTLDMVGWTTL